MAKVILDTQILLFSLSEPSRLSNSQKETFLNPDFQFYIHPISYWEIQIKYDLGKLVLPKEPEIFLPPLIESSGFFIDEFRVSLVFYLNKLPALHKDH